MSNYLADATNAVTAVCATYPDITDERTAYIASAALSAAQTLVETGSANAVENAREDDFDADTNAIVALYTLESLTDESAYEIVRDVARIVMHTWTVASKFDADSFGYHFVMTRNGEGVSFKDTARFPNDGNGGGEYLAFVTKNMFGFPWHCAHYSDNKIAVYAM